ncbi:MAG: hypothetical protein UU98_C0013G0036 [Parcubacteria group bacterium GW2011_GWD2_42_14]|nr:MAG: hypothetical protein UU98_C0013G0036 [Parcubacteria group bacterium GW2011_GWD2_42_14]
MPSECRFCRILTHSEERQELNQIDNEKALWCLMDEFPNPMRSALNMNK